MGVMSIREFNANTSGAFAKVESGETIEVTRHGKVIARVLPPIAKNRMDDPEFRAARERFLAGLGQLDLGGPATYKERTGR